MSAEWASVPSRASSIAISARPFKIFYFYEITAANVPDRDDWNDWPIAGVNLSRGAAVDFAVAVTEAGFVEP